MTSPAILCIEVGFGKSMNPSDPLLAAATLGVHPVVSGRARRSLTDRRSTALSPVAAWYVLRHRTSQLSYSHSKVKRTWLWSGGQQGRISRQPADTLERLHSQGAGRHDGTLGPPIPMARGADRRSKAAR